VRLHVAAFGGVEQVVQVFQQLRLDGLTAVHGGLHTAADGAFRRFKVQESG
jgi:hypothetical protein